MVRAHMRCFLLIRTMTMAEPGCVKRQSQQFASSSRVLPQRRARSGPTTDDA